MYLKKESVINKKAWEHRAYEFWVQQCGLPHERAEIIMENPKLRLRKHGKYFENIEGKKIANICGSNGRRAVALGLLDADVTVFDISVENKRYALELAECCHIKMDYILGDIYDMDTNLYENHFDMLYLEGGILHLFHDIHKFMAILHKILKPDGQIVLNDFHPFRKVMPINFFKSSVEDYFDTSIHEGDVAYKDFLETDENEEIPNCSYRYYTISEILNSMINSGFLIKEFNEEPSWTNDNLPGEFTIFASK